MFSIAAPTSIELPKDMTRSVSNISIITNVFAIPRKPSWMAAASVDSCSRTAVAMAIVMAVAMAEAMVKAVTMDVAMAKAMAMALTMAVAMAEAKFIQVCTSRVNIRRGTDLPGQDHMSPDLRMSKADKLSDIVVSNGGPRPVDPPRSCPYMSL